MRFRRARGRRRARGSGTTSTIARGGHVAITDNADPMNAVVYRKRSGRVHGQVPVFEANAGLALGGDGPTSA